MKVPNKQILLISYVFPPYYGIGGRRWAKQANELTKLGYTVHVISAVNPFKQKSLWTDIVENNPAIILHKLPSLFPKVLVTPNLNFLEKIEYQIWIKVLPLFTRGAYLDRTIFWKNAMLRKSKQIINDYDIENIVCTGGPFGVMYYTTLLRKWFKNIFIINDLRDPWTWGSNWGFPILSSERISHEQLLEKAMIENSDIVTVPTLELKSYLDKNYLQYRDRIKTLFHFFDPEEIIVEEKTKSLRLRLIFYGSVYHHIPSLIEEAARTLFLFRDQISLDFYTDNNKHKTTFEKYGATNVSFHKQLPAKQLFGLFKNYDYVFLMLPDVGVDHISTKFYEVIYTKTPFLILCKYGLAARFVEENNLGIHAELNNLENILRKLTVDKRYKNYNYNFDLSPYSIRSNAEQIDAMFSCRYLLKK